MRMVEHTDTTKHNYTTSERSWLNELYCKCIPVTKLVQSLLRTRLHKHYLDPFKK